MRKAKASRRRLLRHWVRSMRGVRIVRAPDAPGWWPRFLRHIGLGWLQLPSIHSIPVEGTGRCQAVMPSGKCPEPAAHRVTTGKKGKAEAINYACERHARMLGA